MPRGATLPGIVFLIGQTGEMLKGFSFRRVCCLTLQRLGLCLPDALPGWGFAWLSLPLERSIQRRASYGSERACKRIEEHCRADAAEWEQ
jgi:hypothetical protein